MYDSEVTQLKQETKLFSFYTLRLKIISVSRNHKDKTGCNTVVPAMNGHPRDQAKVSVHDRWPLIRGTGGQVKDATYNTPRLSPPAIFILNAGIVIIMYAIVIYTTKIDGVVCPPNISETVAGRLLKLAHRQLIASTTIKLISTKILLSILSILGKKNISANHR